MRLVDDDETYIDGAQELREAFALKPFRRDVEQAHPSLAYLTEDVGGRLPVHRAVY